MKTFLSIFLVTLFCLCARQERDNPFDTQGVNYYPPKVIAMADTTVSTNDTIRIRATGIDSNGIITNYLWAVNGMNFLDTTDTNFIEASFPDSGIHVVKVKVIDDDGLISATDEVKVYIGLFFTCHVLFNPSGSYAIYAIDVDGDGDIDILSNSDYPDKIAWYENDGKGDFTKYAIPTSQSATQVFGIDIDNDGDIDVLSASGAGVTWFENDGSENFTFHVIDTLGGSASSVFAIDIDSDGDIDVISASRWNNKVAWHENHNSQDFITRTITSSADGVRSVIAIDIDSDSDIDVLSANYNDSKIVWYENDGSESFTTHTITTTAHKTNQVFAIDIDGDSDLDVLSTASNRLGLALNDGVGNFSTQHVIDLISATSVFAIDIDGDEDIDVISSKVSSPNLFWYANDGEGNFSADTIKTPGNDTYAVFAIDIDGDGDNDILADQHGGMRWFENSLK